MNIRIFGSIRSPDLSDRFCSGTHDYIELANPFSQGYGISVETCIYFNIARLPSTA
jgi:hypothetical protein